MEGGGTEERVSVWLEQSCAWRRLTREGIWPTGIRTWCQRSSWNNWMPSQVGRSMDLVKFENESNKLAKKFSVCMWHNSLTWAYTHTHTHIRIPDEDKNSTRNSVSLGYGFMDSWNQSPGEAVHKLSSCFHFYISMFPTWFSCRRDLWKEGCEPQSQSCGGIRTDPWGTQQVRYCHPYKFSVGYALSRPLPLWGPQIGFQNIATCIWSRVGWSPISSWHAKDLEQTSHIPENVKLLLKNETDIPAVTCISPLEV